MNPPEENVLVVRRSLFDQLGSFQGLNFEPQKYLDAFLSRGNNFFLARPKAENDPAYKRVERDMSADKTIGLRGTPTFFIGLKGQKPQVETVTTFHKVLASPPYSQYVVLGHAAS